MRGKTLQVNHLTVGFAHANGTMGLAVNDVSFSLTAGRTLCLVGESGCGKSLTALSLMRLLPEKAQVLGGEVFFEGRDVFSLTPQELTGVRGNEIGMIFQDPMSSLNPVMRVGRQVAEPLRRHREYTKNTAHEAVIELFSRVGIPSPQERVFDYPHQLSGGMRQRVVIAQALACQPKLIIADEPTTALDVTVQKQILGVLHSLVHELGSAMLLISHDLSVVSACADEVAVMYAGSIVEQGSVEDVLQTPQHPYTQGLLASRISLLKEAPAFGNRQLTAITGTVPSLWDRPSGCPFHPRCPKAQPICRVESPQLDTEKGHAGEHVWRCLLA